MSTRELNTVLLILAALGALFGYGAVRRHRQLSSECQQLEEEVGRLLVEDSSRIHVVALETGERRHFAWRIFIPADLYVTWKPSTDSGFSRSSSTAEEFIAHVRLEEDDNGLSVYAGQDGGRRGFATGDTHLGDLPQAHWEDVHVERLGIGGSLAVDPDEITTLFQVKCSDESSLFDLRFGSDAAFQRELSAKASTNEF